jgi:hypothetical protein
LAQYAIVHTRSWAANSPNARVRLKSRSDRAVEEAALLREEMRIKDGRWTSIPPQRRPYYSPAARLEILQLRAARNWSLQQTSDAFLVTPATVASWMGRLDEAEPDALVQLREPVNKFPEFVRLAVQRLKTLCPTLGKKKLAQVLARAGLHLGATTVGRTRAAKPDPCSPSPSRERVGVRARRVVTAKRPNHVWHVDLTLKDLLAKFAQIPYRLEEMRRVVQLIVGWYNEHRPHTTLKGATPNERYFKRFPANRKPRIEPRPKWPRGSPCARPHALVAGRPGTQFDMQVEHIDGHKQLPIIRLRRAA